MRRPAPSTPSVAPARRPVGRPRDPAKAAAILDAGWALFLEHGVEAVPIEAIASRAHVSKGTIYANFADKTALFEASMLREMERIETAQQLVPQNASDASLVDTLRAFGLGIMHFLASEQAIGFYGALSADIRRRPDLVRAFCDLGPSRTRANLAAILRGAADRGDIHIDDPFHAADALFGSWQGFSNLENVLDGGTPEARAAILGRVERGIAIFLRAHRPANDSDIT